MVAMLRMGVEETSRMYSGSRGRAAVSMPIRQKRLRLRRRLHGNGLHRGWILFSSLVSYTCCMADCFLRQALSGGRYRPPQAVLIRVPLSTIGAEAFNVSNLALIVCKMGGNISVRCQPVDGIGLWFIRHFILRGWQPPVRWTYIRCSDRCFHRWPRWPVHIPRVSSWAHKTGERYHEADGAETRTWSSVGIHHRLLHGREFFPCLPSTETM